MRDLRLVGLSEDGTRLVLSLPGGEEFSLPVDEQVQVAVRGDNTRLGQLQIQLESRLRPRDMQARIRAGQSVEEVAEEAGISVERVERYAGPILHEREHIAQQAAAAGVRRDDHGAVQLLGELVGERLEQRGVPRELLTWDAWRLDDGRWEVRLDYLATDAPRSALWIYDPARKAVVPDDDEARWLLEEEPSATVTPLRPLGQAPASAGSIPDDVAEVIGLIDNSPGAPATVTVADEPALAEEQRETEPPSQPPTRRAASSGRTSGRSKRATVPSWDEILFGSKKPE